MIRAQFRICLPEEAWVRSVSERFPRATFRLLTGYRLDDRAIELGEVVGDRPEACVEAIRSHPSIKRYERLESATRRVLGKYETRETDLYDFVETASLPVEFPLVVRDGRFAFDLTGTREELERLRATLDAADAVYELQSLVHTTDADGLLTDRQREVLGVAVQMGYFEVPRECTLEAVATAVGVDKATASTVLRRGEGRLVKRFLTDLGTDGRAQ